MFLAIAFFAIFVHGAQINWGNNANAMYSTLVEGVPTTPQQMSTGNGYTITAYLIYLGESGATWDENFTVTSAAPIPVGGDVLGTKNSNAAGRVSPTSNPLTGLNLDSTLIGAKGDVFTENVSTFGVLYIATNTGWDDGAFAWHISIPYTYSSTIFQSGAKYTGGQYYIETPSTAMWTFVPIPEPATAGLALAGLALLFRRKRK